MGKHGIRVSPCFLRTNENLSPEVWQQQSLAGKESLTSALVGDARRMRARLPRLASVAVHPSPSSSSPSSGSNPPSATSSTANTNTSSSRSVPFVSPTELFSRTPRHAQPAPLQPTRPATGISQLARKAAVQSRHHVAVERTRPEGSHAGASEYLSYAADRPESGAAAAAAGPRRASSRLETTDEQRTQVDTEQAVAGPSRLRLSPAEETAPRSSASPRRVRISEDHLENLLVSLPTSEPELYDFLRRAKAAYTSLPPEWLASFHAHPNLADCVSSRTYRFLVRVAFDASNLKLVRALLAEIKERGVRLDEVTKRAILRGYAGLGPRLRREDEAIRSALVDELGAAGSSIRPTKRRNFGQPGKGSNDLDELWKGWAVRGRDRRLREHVDALLSPAATISPPKSGQVSPAFSSSPRAWRANFRPNAAMAATTATAGSTPMKRIALSRPPVLIPPFAHTLPGSDIAGLSQALIGTGRRAEAFDLAETWLTVNRPVFHEPPTSPRDPDPPPSPTDADFAAVRQQSGRKSPSLAVYLRQASTYHSTAVVLLNILLKPLFLERAPTPAIRSFIASFVETHSADRPAPPLVPDVVTLRTLVTGVLGSPTAWDRATSLVDWFGYQWGIPVADPCTSTRHHFLPPSEIESDRLAVGRPTAAAAEIARRTDAVPHLLLVKPHAVVPPDIALLLLRHASDQYSRGLFAQSANRRRVWRQGIRAWWRAFDKDESATDVWTGQKARTVLRKAVKVGLFKPKAVGSRGGGGSESVEARP